MFSSCARRHKLVFSCWVWVDYDLKQEDAFEDAAGWEWVLLGTFSEAPYGLLLHSANGSKWCRVGIFASWPPEKKPRPLEEKQWLMRLKDLTQSSCKKKIMIS